jgi:tRNA(Arg) A34 adenosine deaminase TadA
MNNNPNPRPHNQLLRRAFAPELWEQAERAALTGDIRSFNVGAVMFDSETKDVITTGTSHYLKNGVDTCHAEVDALNKAGDEAEGTEILLVALTKSRVNWAYKARPCAHCALRLREQGVKYIHYAHRDHDGIWSIRTERVLDLALRAESVGVSRFAKKMQLKMIQPLQVLTA